MSPIHFAKHVGFVHIFEYLPLLMLVLAFAGRLSPKLRWMTAGLFALIAVQYMTADARHYGVALGRFTRRCTRSQRWGSFGPRS